MSKSLQIRKVFYYRGKFGCIWRDKGQIYSSSSKNSQVINDLCIEALLSIINHSPSLVFRLSLIKYLSIFKLSTNKQLFIRLHELATDAELFEHISHISEVQPMKFMLDIVCNCPFRYHEREVIHNLENSDSSMLASSLNRLICFVNLIEYKHLINISCFRSRFTGFDFPLLYARLNRFFKIFLTICGQM